MFEGFSYHRVGGEPFKPETALNFLTWRLEEQEPGIVRFEDLTVSSLQDLKVVFPISALSWKQGSDSCPV